jgi:collagenase-like PrtC family protease
MMRFDVPFIPDQGYADFLRENLDRLHSVHFSLYSDAILDARFKPRTYDLDDLIDGLSGLSGVRKYALINSRFHPPGLYADAGHLRDLAGRLTRLLDAGALTGVVYADHYYLQALSDLCGDVAEQLEAVPSVNAMIDSFERAASAMRYLDFTRFRRPSKIILDRSLNRDAARLGRTSRRIRESFPGVGITLLANEGCLFQCPFKPAHDAHIALAGMPFGADATFALNREQGCARYFFKDPAQIFRSPFIRPEDAGRYEGVADVLKLCGRTRGARVMRGIAGAYLHGAFRGNLLDLLDTLECLSVRMFVANHELPSDFFEQINGCARTCESCSYCRDLARKHVSLTSPAPGRFVDGEAGCGASGE